MQHSAAAHRARFQGHIERSPRETIVALPSRRLAQRYDLGVRGRIDDRDRSIVPSADNRAVADDNGSYRHFFYGIGGIGYTMHDMTQEKMIVIRK